MQRYAPTYRDEEFTGAREQFAETEEWLAGRRPEQILIAQRRHPRKASRSRTFPPRRLLDILYDASVGYGYRPGRASWLIAALLILVTGSLEIPAAQATLRHAIIRRRLHNPGTGTIRPAGPA